MSKPYYRVILILLTVACAVCALVTTPIALLTTTWAFDTPARAAQDGERHVLSMLHNVLWA